MPSYLFLRDDCGPILFVYRDVNGVLNFDERGTHVATLDICAWLASLLREGVNDLDGTVFRVDSKGS